MLSKSSGLSRILLSRSKLTSTHRSYACLSNSNQLLNKIKPFDDSQLLKQSSLFLNLNFASNKFHSEIILNQSDDKKSILNPQANKSVLTDDLQNIISKKYGQTDSEDNKSSSGSEDGSKKASEDENEQKGKFEKYFSRENTWKVSLTFLTALFGGSVLYVLFNWGEPKLDENNKPIKDQFSDLPILIQYPKRALHAVLNYYEMMKEPSTDKLLPDPIQPPYYQPPYTLVIEMSGLLLHPEWTFSTGWRYKKRPGLDYFIEQIKYPLFEVVIFTREPFLSGAPIVSSLDPQQLIQFKLFRESTKFIDNNYVKDLSYMNRDPSKIIVLDWDEKAYQLQPRNALHRLKKWEGDDSDAELVYLASFLKMIAASGVEDVRDVLDHYNKEIDPLETFKINQVKLKESESERQKQVEAMLKQKKTSFSLFKR